MIDGKRVLICIGLIILTAFSARAIGFFFWNDFGVKESNIDSLPQDDNFRESILSFPFNSYLNKGSNETIPWQNDSSLPDDFYYVNHTTIDNFKQKIDSETRLNYYYDYPNQLLLTWHYAEYKNIDFSLDFPDSVLLRYDNMTEMVTHLYELKSPLFYYYWNPDFTNTFEFSTMKVCTLRIVYEYVLNSTPWEYSIQKYRFEETFYYDENDALIFIAISNADIRNERGFWTQTYINDFLIVFSISGLLSKKYKEKSSTQSQNTRLESSPNDTS
jgi:hypothetical protein